MKVCIALQQLPHFLAFRSLGFSMRLTSANLRVFLAFPMLCGCSGRHITRRDCASRRHPICCTRAERMQRSCDCQPRRRGRGNCSNCSVKRSSRFQVCQHNVPQRLDVCRCRWRKRCGGAGGSERVNEQMVSTNMHTPTCSSDMHGCS